MHYRFNILEGTVRSGKDTTASVAFVERILISQGTIFLVGAVSVDKGMRIVGRYVIDYFNTEYGKVGAAYRTTYNNADAIAIEYKGIIRYIVFAGGYNNNSQDFIQGDSYAGVYLTEINLLNTDFIQQACQRIIAAKDGFIYGTLNPRSPKDKFYTQFLFRWYQEQLDNDNLKWLNYNKFYLDDNPALTKDMIEAAKKGYDPNSLRYKRDILGMRVDAEGSIYNIHDYNIIKEIPQYLKYITVADFGETISATYFGCYGIYYNPEKKIKEMHLIREWHHINKDTGIATFKYSEDYANDYVMFIKDCWNILGKAPIMVLFDGTTEIFNKIKKSLLQNHMGQITPKFVPKEDMDTRIQMVQNALYNGKLKINENCKYALIDLRNAVYDEKKYENTGKFIRKDVFDENGHADCVDSLDYAITFLNKDLN